MIHIGKEEIKTNKRWQSRVVCAYLNLIKKDYRSAIARNNIDKMRELEQHIMSDAFLGGVVGLSQESTLKALRNSYNSKKYSIIRDREMGFPLRVIEKGKEYGKSEGR